MISMDVYSGTLHVILHGRKRIVVCSDSRGHSEESGPSPEVFQKLFQSGKRTLCGIHGILTLPPDILISNQISKLCSQDELRDLPRELLIAIRNVVEGPIAALFAGQPPPDLPSIFGAFSIQRRRNGELTFWKLDFPVVKALNGDRSVGEPQLKAAIEGFPPAPYFHYFEARGDCLPSDFMERVHPDSPEAEILRGVDDIFAFATTLNKSCADEIGGPIDVAVIDSIGVSWLRKKPIRLPGRIEQL